MLKQSPALVSEKDASFGASPLHWAALKGHGAVVGFLLAQGADDRALNRDNETPLQVAQRANRRTSSRSSPAAIRASVSSRPPAATTWPPCARLSRPARMPSAPGMAASGDRAALGRPQGQRRGL